MGEYEVKRVLSGEASYDSLGEQDQAVVRAIWDKQIAEARERLDLAAEFAANGEFYSEADEDGNVVIRCPDAEPADDSEPFD